MTNRTELTFTTGAEFDEFMSVLGYERLPVREARWACHSFDDHGRPIVTFARRYYAEAGQPFRVEFVETVKHNGIGEGRVA